MIFVKRLLLKSNERTNSLDFRPIKKRVLVNYIIEIR